MWKEYRNSVLFCLHFHWQIIQQILWPRQKSKKEKTRCLFDTAWYNHNIIFNYIINTGNITCTNLIQDFSIQLGPMIPYVKFATSYSTRFFEILANTEGMERQSNTSKIRFSSMNWRIWNAIKSNMRQHVITWLWKRMREETSIWKDRAKRTLPESFRSPPFKRWWRYNRDVKEEEDDGDDDQPLNEGNVIRSAACHENEID